MDAGRLPMGLALALACCLAGCAASHESGVDRGRGADGAETILDTPKTWQGWWVPSVDDEVRREVLFRQGRAQADPLLGKPQGGGDWNGYWLQRIRAVRAGGIEHPQKFVDYILARRRAAGLPELVGYAP